LIIPEAADVRSTSALIGKVLSGFETANYPHEPEPAWVKHTRLPTQSLRSAPLASTTWPVPSNPIVAGSGTAKYDPAILRRSEGFIVEASTLTKSCPGAGTGLGNSCRTGSFPY